MIGVNIDITERKRAEEAVKESETRFRLVSGTAPVMIWMSGLDKKPTYFNQLWLDFTGFSETDLQNRLTELIHSDDYQQCHHAYCRGFDQRQPFRKECRCGDTMGNIAGCSTSGCQGFIKMAPLLAT